jgi:hypothetical protein
MPSVSVIVDPLTNLPFTSFQRRLDLEQTGLSLLINMNFSFAFLVLAFFALSITGQEDDAVLTRPRRHLDVRTGGNVVTFERMRVMNCSKSQSLVKSFLYRTYRVAVALQKTFCKALC